MSRAEKTIPETFYRIGEDDQIKFVGRVFKATRYEGGYLLTEVNGSACYEFEDWQITEHINKRVIEVEAGYYGIDAMNARALKFALDAPDLPKDTVYRTRMVAMFLEGVAQGKWKRSKDSIEEFYQVFDALDNEHRKSRGGTEKNEPTNKSRIGWRQFCRIVRLFERRGRTPNALMKNYNGRNLHTTKVNVEREAFVLSWARKKATRSKTSAISLYGEMKTDNEGLEVQFTLPNLRTFQRRVRRLEVLRVDAGMNSKEVAKTRLAISREGMHIERPLQHVEMDEKTVDLIVLLNETGIWDVLHEDVQKRLLGVKRPFLSVAIDYASRSVLAMRLLKEAPKASTATSTLRMALLPKDEYARKANASSTWPQCGTMERVSTDAGSSWANDDFQACVLQLTGLHLIPPSKNPILRGTIERFFRTVDDRYMHLFSGRTFGNVLARGNYNAVANASMEFEALADALVRLIVDCYHHTPHEGLNGETPIDAWSRLTRLYPVAPPPTAVEMAKVFSMTINRKIGDHGLLFWGIPYGNDALQKLRGLLGGATVQMRVNLYDLSSVRMLTQDGDGYVDLPCLRHGFEGVGAREWKYVLQTMRKRFADRAKVREPWIRSAVAEVMAVSQKSMAEASIVEHTLTQAAYEQVERELVGRWVVPGRAQPDYPAVIPGSPDPIPPSPQPSGLTVPTAATARRKAVLGMGEVPSGTAPATKSTTETRLPKRPAAAPNEAVAEPAPTAPKQSPAGDTKRPSLTWSIERKK